MGQDPSVSTAECLDLGNHQWQALPSMPSPRRGLALLSVGHLLYALGGSDGSQATDVVEVFDTRNGGQWEVTQPIPGRRAYFGAAATHKLEVLGLTRGQFLAYALRDVNSAKSYL